MFDWLSRKSEVWSLEALTPPWRTGESLYEIVVQGARTALPDDEPNGKVRWAAGALDGVMGHHAGRGDGSKEVQRTVNAVRALLARSSSSNLRKVYGVVCEAPLLGYVDQLLPAIEAEFSEDKVRLAALARLFLSKAPRREPVKFGIALLGLAGSPSDVDALRRIGACDEFTLFAAVAIQNLSPTYERDLWELAKTVDGWGRIHLVERLAHTEDYEIRAWLLRDGFHNCIMSEYVACICARAGKLHEALRTNPRDSGLLDSATDLIHALITGGPAEDIDDYEHAAEAIEAYLDAVWIQTNRKPLTFVVVDQIREWLTSDDGWEERSKCGWTMANRERCLQLARELLSKDGWMEEAISDLASPGSGAFYWRTRPRGKWASILGMHSSLGLRSIRLSPRPGTTSPKPRTRHESIAWSLSRSACFHSRRLLLGRQTRWGSGPALSHMALSTGCFNCLIDFGKGLVADSRRPAKSSRAES